MSTQFSYSQLEYDRNLIRENIAKDKAYDEFKKNNLAMLERFEEEMREKISKELKKEHGVDIDLQAVYLKKQIDSIFGDSPVSETTSDKEDREKLQSMRSRFQALSSEKATVKTISEKIKLAGEINKDKKARIS